MAGRKLVNIIPAEEAKRLKHCNGCNRDLPRDHFYRSVRGGVISKCKECWSKYQTNYRSRRKQKKQIPWSLTY